MQAEQRVSVRQMKVLLIFFIVGDLMWYLPSYTAGVADQDAWMAALLGVGLGIGVSSFIYWFGSRFPGMTMIDIHRHVLGKFAGGMLSLLFLLHLMSNGSAQIRVIGDFMTTQMMTETPLRVVLFLFAVVVLISVRTGLTVIARTGQVFFMMFMLLFTILILLLIPESEPSNILPIASHSAADIFRGGLFVVAFPYCQMTVFLMLFPLLEEERLSLKQYMIPLLIGGAVIIIVVTLSILVLGAYMTQHQLYSTYTMAKKISIGNFLQRLEAILVINYLLSTYFKCVITMYAFCRGVTQLFGLRDYRVLTLPIFLLIFGYAYVISTNVVFFNSLGPAWALWEMSNVIFLLGFVYVVHLLKVLMKGKPLHSS
jgi:spore germination protein KB